MLNKLIATYIAEKDGATAIEYGLLAAGISVGIIAVLVVLGPQISGAFQDVSDGLTTFAG
jgi:pilus assembly protein Flp/PilA